MCQPLYQKVGLIIKLGPQQRPHQDYEAVALLKEIERHDFLVFALAGCRADANQPHFFRRANYFFGGQQEITSLISNIRSKTYDFYNQSRFLDNVVKWFDTGDGDDRGFSEWRQIEYFLLEYENFLREVAGEPAIVLKSTHSREFILSLLSAMSRGAVPLMPFTVRKSAASFVTALAIWFCYHARENFRNSSTLHSP